MIKSMSPMKPLTSGVGRGGGKGNLGVILVRVCEPVFKTYLIQLPGLRKKQTHSYT